MAKLVKPLSDMEIKKTETKDKDYKLSDGQGLCLIVKPNGTKYFRFDLIYGSKKKSTSFGVYPIVILKEAREKREEARQLLANNINPISVKRIKKALESLTLQNVVDEWIELRKKSSSDATVIQNKRILKNITNWLGSVAIKDIKRINIITALEKMQNREIIELAHRLLSIMNKMYMYAVAKEKMKMKVDFVCPLPTQSIKILKQIEPFSKYRGNTLNKLGYQDKHTLHGFRSMFSTIAYKLYKEHGFHSDII